MQGVHKTMDTKSRRMCSVPQCTGSLYLHSFPLERKLRDIWKQTLGIRKPITKYMAVCSKHFVPEDYYYGTNNYKRFKKGIVPSQNLPVEKMVQFQTKNPVLQEAKPIETVMLFSQEDLWASDEYDKLLQVSCREEEQIMYSDQSPSPRKNEFVRNNEDESTKRNSQLPSGYDKLLIVKYEEEIKPNKGRSGRHNEEESTKRNSQLPSGYDKLLVVKYEEEIKPKKRRSVRTKEKIYNREDVKTENKRSLPSSSAEKKSYDKYGEFQTRNGHLARKSRPVGTKTKKYKHEDVKTENKRSLPSCSAKKKNFDKYGEFQTRNGHSARKSRSVGSKNVKLKKVQISDDYYDLLDASSAYKEEFETNTKPSRINNKPHWYIEFVDKGTQTDSIKETPYVEPKYKNRSTQTTRYIENS